MRLSGFLVNPEEIESQLTRIPGVAEAQVVAIEIEGRTRCVAFVIPSPDTKPTEAGIISAAAKLMAGFKLPARVWFVDAFPVTPSANATKIQRRKEVTLLPPMASARECYSEFAKYVIERY
jgi:fatty-acyl-CoA synthase